MAASPSAADIRRGRKLPLVGVTALLVTSFALPGPARAVEDQRSLPLCQVLDGPASSVDEVGPVIRSAALTSDPTNPSWIATLGYGVNRQDYPRSAATAWDLTIGQQRKPVCATDARLRVYGVLGGESSGPALLERSVSLASGESHQTVQLLVADLPAGDSTGSGPCLAAEVALTDAAGGVIQVAPTTGPLVICPGSGDEATFGG